MLKKYLAPTIAEVKLQQNILAASNGIDSELTGDGKLAPDVFYDGDN